MVATALLFRCSPPNSSPRLFSEEPSRKRGYSRSSSPLSKLSIKWREVGKDDVKIDILYCGVCHADLYFARNEWHFTVYPAVPGQEIVGRVAQVGSEVRDFSVGDQVGVGCIVDSCRSCASCREGLEQYCEIGMTGTYGSTEKVIGGPWEEGGYHRLGRIGRGTQPCCRCGSHFDAEDQ
jgi:uncharacterized zinc-type alcohol dehydrogenase-like protein